MAEIEFRTGVIRPVECFKEGWELIKSDYWLLFAIALVGGLIGGISMYVLLGAMACGIYYCYLQKIDGKPVSLDGLWKGFGYFMPSLLVTIVIVVPMLIVFAVAYFPLIMMMVMGSKLSPDEFMQMFVGALAVDFIIAIVMVCFHTLLIFSFPLIVDRNLSGWQAITTSAKAVWKNMSGVVGIIGVNFALAMLGYLLCVIGLYFVIPVMIAGNVVAYRKIFPSSQNPNQPPPPNAYQGAGSYT